LYLKREIIQGDQHYTIRETYRSDGCLKHRILFDLGADPGSYIEYPGGNSFYIRESLLENLRLQGVEYSENDLEGLFIPFLDPHVRRIVERFTRRGSPRWKPVSSEALLRHHKALHAFDKRRLHYLRFGRVHIGDLDAKPWKFLNVLLEKSRDEIETLLEVMEWELQPQEIRRYLYTALGLQRHFRHLPTRYHPEALDPFKVEDCFLEEICRLNRDERFFMGVNDHDPAGLHPYLRKYVIVYFDNAFDPRIVWDEYVADFVWRHRFSRRSGSPQGGISGSEKEACLHLGITLKEFEKMDRRELLRIYRRLALKSHPDQGGDKEAFIRLRAAYERLLQRKG
jgi:hypothetical protein